MENALLLVAAPPVMACLVWLLSRAWAFTVQGGRVSEMTKRRQRLELRIIIPLFYVIEIVTLLAKHRP